MKKLIFIMIFLVIGICVVALYAEYKPMYRILAQLEEDEADEFTMIQSALNNRRAIIQEQELLITDLLIKHLIYGVPVGRERLNKLGVKVSGGFYCAYVLVGHILLTGEVEEMTEERYQQMVQDVDSFGNLVRQGYFAKKLLTDAVFKLLYD